ncbi:MAG TPA: hypothetical protein VH083_18055 [Myxococcales bacterium]|jgi:hypothetical protein|nr:hypothetical protein [Myxococcales bacterium]
MKSKEDLPGYMEFASVVSAQLDIAPDDLLRAAEETAIHTFGWPIGLVLHRADATPHPTEDGIEAEIGTNTIDNSYDYWRLGSNGDYYILKSLFEDGRSERRVIFFDTRVVRTAEVFLRTARLYKALGVPGDHVFNMRIEYGGLRGRVLSVISPSRMPIFPERISSVDSIVREYEVTVDQVLSAAGLKNLVYDVTKRLGEVFQFFRADQGTVNQAVDAFLVGRIT